MGAFPGRIREIRESLAMNKSEFALFMKTNVANITRYEKGNMGVSLEAIEKIAEKAGVNPGWLIGWSDEKYPSPATASRQIPIVGFIAAGTPVLAQENIEGYFYVSEETPADFCLRVKGDSMMGARILDGDLVCIKRRPTIENGDIAAVLIDGEEATLKRVFFGDGTVTLHAENPNYPDMVFTHKSMRQINIIGKAVAFQSKVR